MMQDMPLHEGFPVAPRSRIDIRANAVNAREVLELPLGRLNIPRLLDDLTRFGIYYDIFDRDTAPVAAEVEACFVPEERTMYIRDSIYAQMCNGGQRAVFTFGHELGHAVLAHRRTFNRQRVADVPLYCQSEWQANTFAAEFTMPLAEIQALGLWTPEALAMRFGVSMAAARTRLQDLARRGELGKKKP